MCSGRRSPEPRLLLLQRIDPVVETDLHRRLIDEMPVELAAGLERGEGFAGEAEGGGELVGIDRRIARAHLAERGLEQIGGRILFQRVFRPLAGETARAANLLGPDRYGFAEKRIALG